MKVSILTSGFSDGFTTDFIECVKYYYDNKGTFVFVASDFEEYEKNDKYMDIFLRMFESKGIVFRESCIIDNRATKMDAVKYIKKADIIWLSGGCPLTQIRCLKEYDLIESLLNRDGITIGMSAGSINMAKNVVLAKDVDDNIEELAMYSGIGLVDINIEPHLDLSRKEHMNDIYEASHYATIYGIFDNTFIKIVDDSIEIYGDYIKYES